MRLALRTGSSAALRACLSRGESPESADDCGTTALMLAASGGHVEICRLLLEAGADPGRCDGYGRRADEMAESAGHLEVATLLRDTVTHPGSGETSSGIQQVNAACSAPRSQETSGADSWEPEPEQGLPTHDTNCVAESLRWQLIVGRHQAVDRDGTWSDVAVELPAVADSRRADRFSADFRLALRSAIARALEDGWLNPHDVAQHLSGRPEAATERDNALVAHVARVMGDVGVAVDDESWFMPLDQDSEAAGIGPSDTSISEDLLVELESLLEPRHDPAWVYGREIRRGRPLLKHEEEKALGKAMRNGLCAAVRKLCAAARAQPALLAEIEALATESRGADSDESAVTSARFVADPADDDRELDEDREASETTAEWQEMGSSDRLVAAIRSQVRADPPHFDRTTPELDQAVISAGVHLVQLSRVVGTVLPRINDRALAAGLMAELHKVEVARTKLIERNLRLVVAIARNFIRSGVSLQDLVQEGNIGLMRAADRFDPTREVRFSTYATWWIRQGIYRCVANTGRLIRVPVHMLERLRGVEKVLHALGEAGAPSPDQEALARMTGLTTAEVSRALRIPAPPAEFDDESNGDLREAVLSVIDESPSPEEACFRAELRRLVEDELSAFKPREAKIVKLRFGIGVGEAFTLEQIGDMLDVTRERIRQIESKVLRRLGNPVRVTALKVALGLIERDFTSPNQRRGRVQAAQQSNTSRTDPSAEQTEKPDEEPRGNEPGTDTAGQDTPQPSQHYARVASILQLLASPRVQRAHAATILTRSHHRDFALRWFSAYNPIDPEDGFSGSEHALFHELSANLRKAMRSLGPGACAIDDLLSHSDWQAVILTAARALSALQPIAATPEPTT
jgi:RNA polymerase primary sigma factor